MSHQPTPLSTTSIPSLADIPQEFIDKCKLNIFSRNSWVYFEMRHGMYGCPQAGILANNLLQDCLAKFNYYEAATTPGLWRHKWCPIMFALINDDFTIQYIGDAHLDHLCQALRKHYKVSKELNGTRFAGMILKWNYSPNHTKCSCCLSMPGCICNVRTKYKHLKHHEIVYDQTTQLTHDETYSLSLSTEGIKRIQGIIGTLLCYARAVDKKLLAMLSTLSSQQATPTKGTNNAINQLLDYFATYPNNSTT
jgi:hypothetical protein